ncbi:hypothetical protein E2C01_082157 [Portunus trituberculatus]|uniref:Uncharacterized protein n=1 Tax=Portunus trituberculatus TaxID=210409 RepID=A0A5B7IYC1_PORTR|nr:hypothetical protein [Portunus trituberculatus]
MFPDSSFDRVVTIINRSTVSSLPACLKGLTNPPDNNSIYPTARIHEAVQASLQRGYTGHPEQRQTSPNSIHTMESSTKIRV